MIYTVTFNPALDYVVRVTDFCLGATNRCEREELYCGGKGINVSLVLHELGIQNTALGFIAGFTGTALKQKLNAHGITTDFILLPKGFSRINIKLKSGEETEINGRGPQIDPQSLEALYRKLDALRPGDTLVLAEAFRRRSRPIFTNRFSGGFPDGSCVLWWTPPAACWNGCCLTARF